MLPHFGLIKSHLSTKGTRGLTNNSETIKDIEQIVSIYFQGPAETVRILLENYVNDTLSYGKELTVSDK